MSTEQSVRENKIRGKLIGKTITNARWLTQEESEDLGWHKRPFMISFGDEDEYIIAMCDDEGNDGGSLLTNWGEGVIWTK